MYERCRSEQKIALKRPTVIQHPPPARKQVVRQIEQRIVWMPPLDKKTGSYTAMAYDEDGHLIAMAEQGDWEDAIIAIADQLSPEGDQRE